MKTKHLLLLILSVLLIYFFHSCTTHLYNFRSDYNNLNDLVHETSGLIVKPYLKAHLKNGDVCILKDTWKIDTVSNTISGTGVEYDYNRIRKTDGPVSISIDSVAIFETNKKPGDTESSRVSGLAIIGSLDVLLGIICLTNPKACFGSCPTFYLNEKDNFHYADAEGFSNAILPSMEYGDIDALNSKNIPGDTLRLTMKNEALETHCIKELKVLAYPLNEGERVYQSPENDFYLTNEQYRLSAASADEGAITSLLKEEDRNERYSLSDEKNLDSKEEVILEYKIKNKDFDPGLVLHFRQTLMSTYFFYSAMGYMGNEVSDIFANLETNKDSRDILNRGIKNKLGGIGVYWWNNSSSAWEYIDQYYETGPIAINRQLIPLKIRLQDSKIKLKLVLNKGLWRIDYAGLANIKSRVSPVTLSPVELLNKGREDKSALNKFNSAGQYVYSMPGSEYRFCFRMPEKNKRYELFLYSKGYYLEWMRAHWFKDKDLLKLRQMVHKPEEYLRSEAKNYKKYESTMETEFWNSKIDTKAFSYHEN